MARTVAYIQIRLVPAMKTTYISLCHTDQVIGCPQPMTIIGTIAKQGSGSESSSIL